ncbi:adenylate/guanylate cyclase domain-containing protein [Winogradskyella luteola]|uniref:Adenylate/guanylate cyclase domain-containing protein n=1 Tax=Winogradskyella luteola TaxID=2828330 RepID=A0A9X1F938_9FLAO|nr:adenylate/guanylate cyclase domain-containing protein [Winogradskyella luteola]MBV7268683.1 adenylate/guanylate cyclase domain-containing protein [Winogradskyella luteola]
MSNRLLAFLQLFVVSIAFWLLAFTFFIVIRYNGLTEELAIYTDEDLGIPISAFYKYGIILGLILGVFYAIIEFLFDEFFSKKFILGISIIVKSLIYFVLIVVVLSLLSFNIEEQIDIDLPNERGWWHTDPFFWNTVIYFVTASIIFSLIRIANDKFGRGMFINTLLGKYRKPREEERILMFLDLKDSTKIAEKIGHIRYSKFIQDCFTDLNKVLNKYDAEIHQYVGDEAVITWTVKKGFRRNNCINLFFAFQEQLMKRKTYYLATYSFEPIFKAGIHFGRIMIAEVGTIKKEIAYHGDVINTASRIQSLCNKYNTYLLISETLLEEMKIVNQYQLDSKGSITLTGKEKAIEVFGISK